MDTITTAVEEITIDSNRIIHETEAELVTRNIPNVIRIVQYDQTLPVIAVALKKAGTEYALPAGAACNIRIRKPDGTVIYNPAYGCSSSRKIVYFEVTLQMAIVAGELNPTIEVVVSGKVAGTSPLRVIVEENPVKIDDEASEDERQTIAGLVGEAEQARDDAQAAAETAAHDAMIDCAVEAFKSIATYEATSTASQPYVIGDYIGYDGKLYRVTTAISSGGTITPGTNCYQTNLGNEIKGRRLWKQAQAIASTNGSSGTLCTITDPLITADHVLTKFVPANSNYIISGVSCTPSAGQVVITGISTAATTAEIMLEKPDRIL